MSSPSYLPVNWPAAGTTSQAYQLSGQNIVGFYTASTLTSTSLTFSVCDTAPANGFVPSYQPLKAAPGGSAVTFTVAPSGYYAFTADLINQFRGVENFKIVGGSSESVGQQVVLALRVVE